MRENRKAVLHMYWNLQQRHRRVLNAHLSNSAMQVLSCSKLVQGCGGWWCGLIKHTTYCGQESKAWLQALICRVLSS
jgi:hypothetical protein